MINNNMYKYIYVSSISINRIISPKLYSKVLPITNYSNVKLKNFKKYMIIQSKFDKMLVFNIK